MKKRILALVLALFMVVAILPTAALAAEGNANITVGLTLTGILTMRIPATSTMAIGISMISDKPATMKASQYKLYAGTAAANDYIAAHTAPQE